MNNIKRLGLLSGAVLAATTVTATLNAAPAQAVSFAVKGSQCPTATCVDLGNAGYTVSGGAITDMDIKNSAKTPGTDSGTTYDPFDDSDKVTSYNVTSAANTPDGAETPIKVSGLDGTFDFFWGSVDTYNFISLFSGDTLLKTFSGKNIANSVGITNPANAQGNYHFDAFVSFMGDFDNVKLFNQVSNDAKKETLIAFEVAAATVPEPASLVGLAAVGLLSGGSLLSRKKQQA